MAPSAHREAPGSAGTRRNAGWAQGGALLAWRLGQAGPVELPAGQDPAVLARYLFAISFGLAVQAAGGATAAELHQVIDVVMSSWPAPPG